MEPVRERLLQKRINALLKTKGHYLVRTPHYSTGFERLGRWSRWCRQECFETHIDLEEMAVRLGCVHYIPQPIYLGQFRAWRNRSPGAR